MHTFQSDTAKLIHTIVEGIGIIIMIILVLGAVFGTPYMIQKGNNEKVREMTTACVAKGYDGWEDDISQDRTERGEAPRGCFHNDKD